MNKFQISKGFTQHQFLGAGFTLIELLVVIAVLAVLSVGLIAAINPLDKVNAAGDARVISDVGVMARALESYSSNQGYYPAVLDDLKASSTQELKSIPVPRTGQCGATNTYDGGTTCDFTASANITPSGAQAACTTALENCQSVIIVATLKSNKYQATPWWRYESATGKTCAKAAVDLATALGNAAACP